MFPSLKPKTLQLFCSTRPSLLLEWMRISTSSSAQLAISINSRPLEFATAKLISFAGMVVYLADLIKYCLNQIKRCITHFTIMGAKLNGLAIFTKCYVIPHMIGKLYMLQPCPLIAFTIIMSTETIQSMGIKHTKILTFYTLNFYSSTLPVLHIQIINKREINRLYYQLSTSIFCTLHFAFHFLLFLFINFWRFLEKPGS